MVVLVVVVAAALADYQCVVDVEKRVWEERRDGPPLVCDVGGVFCVWRERGEAMRWGYCVCVKRRQGLRR